MSRRVAGVMKAWLWAIVLGIALSVVPLTATAAPAACGQRADIVALLAKQFNEMPVAVGVDNNGNLVEVLSSRSGSTWSVIVTTPKGISCLVASGEDWHVLRAVDEEGPQV